MAKRKRVSLDEKKVKLLDELRRVRRDILSEAQRIPPQAKDAVLVGEWSILDLLAHLVGWDFANKQASMEILNGQVPSFYSSQDKGWASFNAELVTKHKQDSIEKMIDITETSHKELIDYLESLQPEEIFKDQGVRKGSYKVIISRLMEVEKKDEIEHLGQITHFLDGLSTD
jgi:hypothetical protein